MVSTESGAEGAAARGHISALLARYPDLAQHDLERIHAWFRKEASALDLGLLASDPAIAERYRAYRSDHYDRITARDYGQAAVFLAVTAAILAFALLVIR